MKVLPIVGAAVVVAVAAGAVAWYLFGPDEADDSPDVPEDFDGE